MYGGKVYIEDEYPYLVFAKDGEEYIINGKKILVIGGAYSVDAEYRLMNGIEWFKDEQLSEEEMNMIMYKVKGKEYDLVLTHTCPHKYEPVEDFLPSIDQSKVDRTMEYFLDKVEESIRYKKWYCGHYHTEKKKGNLEFMYESIKKME
jgi:3-oxoacid CoA-transferase subunit A